MKLPIVRLIMVLLMVGAITFTAPPTAIAQQQEQVQTFSDTDFGYRFNYPSGWVVEDLSPYSQSMVEAAEERIGYRGLFSLCPEDDAIPALGGGYSCEALGSEEETESDAVYAFGFSDLDRKISRQLGQITGATDATVEDAFAYFTQRVAGRDNPDTPLNEERRVEDLVSRTPMTVPVVDSNGQVVAQANGTLVEYVYGSDIYGELLAPDIRAYQFFAIYNNDAVAIGIEGEADDVDSGEVPELLQIIADSFAFTTPTATTTPSQPPAAITPTV